MTAMTDHRLLEHSARNLLSDVLATGDWLPSLDAMMSTMNVLGGGIARAVPPDLFAIPTSGIRDQFREFRTADRPPFTARSIVTSTTADDFVADYMVISEETRARDVFFQEFLRPRHCCHEASAFLDETDVGSVRLLLFRDERQGRFEREDLAALRSTLPFLRSAALISRSAQRTTVLRQAEPFEGRREPVVYLGPNGRVIEMNAAAEDASGRLFTIVNRKIATIQKTDQPRFERVLASALLKGRAGALGLNGLATVHSTLMLVVPIAGRAKDLFNAVSALAVFIETGRRKILDEAPIRLLQQAAGLTGREVDVVHLVGSGFSPRDAADCLGMGYGTLRNHLKASFGKLGVHTQTELLSLIQRLR